MPPTEVERIVALEAVTSELRKDVGEIRDDVKALRSEMAGRPTWAVTTIITLLTACCTGLGAALVSVAVT